MAIQFGLNEILGEIKETRNKIAVEAKVRPATIYDMAEGKTKRIELSTIESILDVINELARNVEGLNKTYTIDDLFKYSKKDAE
ncbi:MULTISPECIES: XRE family transcriptional regulator [Peribacillus]|uniref:XRE family transcriptional regulator n=1 Tax=Peribacillus TaxID=2675229 RepID=UPI001911D6E1|nr:XRE family transcriptional regulator [Peribacillus sp. TH14]MBK5500921.1 XRE family transcriptional regulator [Peribacillus sp. TH14]